MRHQRGPGADASLCGELGLAATTSGRVNAVGKVAPMAARCKAAGYECATLHVGWGWESDAEMDRPADDIVAAW